MSVNSFFTSKKLQNAVEELEKQRTMYEAWRIALHTDCKYCAKRDICTLKNVINKQPPFVFRDYAALMVIALDKICIRVKCEHYNRDLFSGAFAQSIKIRYHSSLPCENCNFSAFCTIKALKSELNEQIELIRNIDDCLKVDVACCVYEERKDGDSE